MIQFHSLRFDSDSKKKMKFDSIQHEKFLIRTSLKGPSKIQWTSFSFLEKKKRRCNRSWEESSRDAISLETSHTVSCCNSRNRCNFRLRRESALIARKLPQKLCMCICMRALCARSNLTCTRNRSVRFLPGKGSPRKRGNETLLL